MENTTQPEPVNTTELQTADNKYGVGSLINKQNAKAAVLAAIQKLRPDLAAEMTRVKGDYYDFLDEALVACIERRIKAMPATGKTISYGPATQKDWDRWDSNGRRGVDW